MTRATETVLLSMIDQFGVASLEQLLVEVDGHVSLADVARAFQSIRSAGLIEVATDGDAPAYRLTPLGVWALGGGGVRAA